MKKETKKMLRQNTRSRDYGEARECLREVGTVQL